MQVIMLVLMAMMKVTINSVVCYVSFRCLVIFFVPIEYAVILLSGMMVPWMKTMLSVMTSSLASFDIPVFAIFLMYFMYSELFSCFID